MGNPARWKWKAFGSPESISFFIATLTCLLVISQIGPVSASTYDEDQWTNWSDWSPCSRTCDGGITQQFRRCKSPHGCHGVSIRRKMCNMQPCNEHRDYRNEQCRSFNGKEYRGKKYSWEAIEDPDNPCALICRAEGTDFIAKLSPKLRDGTRCRSGSLHVCVDGRCETVGCDLKLGSPKKVDECGICGGDGSKCTSPVYNWEMLATGPCTLNCGGGQQPVKIVCRNSLTSEVVDHFLCNSASKPHRTSQSCNIHPCEPEWQAGEWSLCSVTCGGGLRIRKVFCAQEKNGTKIQVADKLCTHIRKPANQEPCNLDTCPYWHAGPWSSCSVSCGKGYKTRNVVCRDAMNLPSSACDPELKPADTKSCTDSAVCPSPIVATTTSTTTSTTTLAPTALVISRTGPTAKKRRVSVKTTPPEPPVVSTMAEPENKNFMETFSASRASYPTDDYTDGINEDLLLPMEHTLPLIQPYPPMDNAVSFDRNAIPSEPTKVRVYFACGWLFLSFVAEEWGPCSQTCGEGVRKRDVKCKIFLEFSRTIANLPDKECPGPKPTETESCFARSCSSSGSSSQEKDLETFEKLSDSQQALQAAEPDPSSLTSNYRNKGSITVGLPPGISMQDMTFSWKVVGYSPCSASCLGGIQEAMIQCVRDYDQRIATPVLCMDKAQPDIATTRTCNDHPCPPRWNVSDFGPCSKPCGGGVMIREVNCIHEVTRGNTVIVPNSICPQPAPKTERLCNAVHCPPFWEPGDWSRCSKPCGGGERTRPLYCKQITALGQIIDLSNGERHCPQSKPIETRACNQKPCSGRKGSKQASPNDSMTSGSGSGSIGPSTSRTHAFIQQEWKKRLSLTARGHATVYAGILLKLRCPSGKGVDRTRLVWMKGHDYVNIQPHKIEVLDKHGILKIKNTTFSDSAIYTCVYNGRPVSNITLMVRPYTGPSEADQRRNRIGVGDKTRERGGVHDSTLFADQQPGVSVPMSDERDSIITPNSKIFSDSSSVSASSGARPQSPFTLVLYSFHAKFSSIACDLWRLVWPLAPLLRKNSIETLPEDGAIFREPETGQDFNGEYQDNSITSTSTLPTFSNRNLSTTLLPHNFLLVQEPQVLDHHHGHDHTIQESLPDFELEEMIGWKTKVFAPSTIKTPPLDEQEEEDTSAFASSTTSWSSSSPTTSSDETTGKILGESTTTNLYLQFGLDLLEEQEEEEDGAQVSLPNHISLSTSTTPKPPSPFPTFSQAGTEFSPSSTEDMLLMMLTTTEESGERRTEVVEPFLLECSSTSLEDGGQQQSNQHQHRHRHHHGHHNSNYNRYQSNRRRRRWRNNHNGGQTGSQRRVKDNEANPVFCSQSKEKIAAEQVMTSTTSSTSAPAASSLRYHPRRQGVWKVGNWTLCETKECFTWNTASRKRQTWCEFQNGTTASHQSICDSALKPAETEECYNPECTGIWRTEKWSQCTARCNEIGFKTRILKCVWQGSFRPAGHACYSLPRPLVKKSCRGQPCPLNTSSSSISSSNKLSSSNLMSNSNTKLSSTNPTHQYPPSRRVLSEQALRSRLNMLDRNTLLEEFLRFFHFYYYDQHNQHPAEKVAESEENHHQVDSKLNHLSLSDTDSSDTQPISHSIPFQYSSASTGHNKNNNNFNPNHNPNKVNKYSVEEDNYFGDY